MRKIRKIRCEGCGIEFYRWESHPFNACLQVRLWRDLQVYLDQLELDSVSLDVSQSRVIRHD